LPNFTKLCKRMFPDSNISKQKFVGVKTKTNTIIKNAISPADDEDVARQCKNGLFSFGCYESNEQNQQKTLTILVKYFD